jgi:hypothetical protein
MDIRRSVLGDIATCSGQTVSSVDVGVLVRRLILFDKVMVRSFRLVAGAIDSFLVDRVLPRSGIVAFLTKTYRSLFASA